LLFAPLAGQSTSQLFGLPSEVTTHLKP
jgi:hypothetical protein